MEPFRNDNIDIAQLPKMEDIQFTKLPGEYLSVKLIIVAIQSVIMVGGLIGLFLTAGDSFAYKIEAFAAVGLLIAYMAWYSWLSFHRIGYHLRERDMLYHRGVLSIKTTVVPYNRIQHVTIDEGVLMRAFSLASLNIYTAGGTNSDLHIPGLHKNTATRIKEFLTEEVTAGVATLDDESTEAIAPNSVLVAPNIAGENKEIETDDPFDIEEGTKRDANVDGDLDTLSDVNSASTAQDESTDKAETDDPFDIEEGTKPDANVDGDLDALRDANSASTAQDESTDEEETDTKSKAIVDAETVKFEPKTKSKAKPKTIDDGAADASKVKESAKSPETGHFESDFVPHPPSKPVSRVRSVDDMRSGNIRKAGSAPKFDVSRSVDDSEKTSNSQK